MFFNLSPLTTFSVAFSLHIMNEVSLHVARLLHDDSDAVLLTVGRVRGTHVDATPGKVAYPDK